MSEKSAYIRARLTAKMPPGTTKSYQMILDHFEDPVLEGYACSARVIGLLHEQEMAIDCELLKMEDAIVGFRRCFRGILPSKPVGPLKRLTTEERLCWLGRPQWLTLAPSLGSLHGVGSKDKMIGLVCLESEANQLINDLTRVACIAHRH